MSRAKRVKNEKILWRVKENKKHASILYNEVRPNGLVTY
jgi:hypothetical protein